APLRVPLGVRHLRHRGHLWPDADQLRRQGGVRPRHRRATRAGGPGVHPQPERLAQGDAGPGVDGGGEEDADPHRGVMPMPATLYLVRRKAYTHEHHSSSAKPPPFDIEAAFTGRAEAEAYLRRREEEEETRADWAPLFELLRWRGAVGLRELSD